MGAFNGCAFNRDAFLVDSNCGAIEKSSSDREYYERQKIYADDEEVILLASHAFMEVIRK